MPYIKGPNPRPNGSYILAKEKDVAKVKQLLKQGHKPIFYKHYFMLNGEVFNGFLREEVEKLMGEECKEETKPTDN